MSDSDSAPPPIDSADALRARALAEVRETSAEARAAALAELRERIAGYNEAHAGERHGLFGRGPLKRDVTFYRADDDAFLIAMLRGAKYDVEKALRKEVAYSRWAEENREWCTTPDLDVVARVFGGVFAILPERDVHGRRVWFFNVRKQVDLAEAEPAAGGVSATDQVRASFWVMQGVIGRDEAASLEGVVIVQDMSDVDIGRMNRAIPQEVNKAALRLFGLYPWRLKRIAVAHEPRWIGLLFALVRPFMPGKIRGRIGLYGRNYGRLRREFGVTSLPRECGGDVELIDKESAAHALRLVALAFPEFAEDVGVKIADSVEG